jgi:hypothetical protein
MKIAIATSPEDTVFHGHFAHAPVTALTKAPAGR